MGKPPRMLVSLSRPCRGLRLAGIHAKLHKNQGHWLLILVACTFAHLVMVGLEVRRPAAQWLGSWVVWRCGVTPRKWDQRLERFQIICSRNIHVTRRARLRGRASGISHAEAQRLRMRSE